MMLLCLVGVAGAADPIVLRDDKSVAYSPSFSADGKLLALSYPQR